MNATIRCSVAAFVVDRRGRFLAVRRPPDDDRLPNVWGLPAVTLEPGELPEAGLRRIGLEKLGTELEPVRLLGIASADRGDHELILMDIQAQVRGREPDVHEASSASTVYVDQQWTTDREILRDGAARGSLCCRIVLEQARLPGSQ